MNLFKSVNKKLMCFYPPKMLFNSIQQTCIILIISFLEERCCICFLCNYFLFTSLVREWGDLKCRISQSQSDSVIRSPGRILFVMMHLKLSLLIRLSGEVHHKKNSFLKNSWEWFHLENLLKLLWWSCDLGEVKNKHRHVMSLPLCCF